MSGSARLIAVLKMVEDDMEQDTIALEGKPFTGAVVAGEMGKIRAALSVLAKIVRTEIEAGS